MPEPVSAADAVQAYYIAIEGTPTQENYNIIPMHEGMFEISHQDNIFDVIQRFETPEVCPIPGGAVEGVFVPQNDRELSRYDIRKALREDAVERCLKKFNSNRPVTEEFTPDIEDDTRYLPFPLVFLVPIPDKAKAAQSIKAVDVVEVSYIAIEGVPNTENHATIPMFGGVFKISRQDDILTVEQRFNTPGICPIPGGIVEGVCKPRDSRKLKISDLRKALRENATREYLEEFFPDQPVTDKDALDIQDDTRTLAFTLIFIVPLRAAPTPLKYTEASQALELVTNLETRAHTYPGLVRNGKTPSQAAQLAVYRDIQASSSQALIDGRYTGAGESMAIPIETFHHAFANFMADCNNPHIIVPEKVVRLTAKLMRSCSQIQLQEIPRENDVSQLLCEILDCTLEQMFYLDGTSPDYVATQATIHNISAALLVLEIQSELGQSGEPGVQASFSFAQWFCQETRNDIRESSCCPSFVVGLAGPWLVIGGAVITTQTIVQRLTPFESLSLSRVLEESHIIHVARVLYSLSCGIKALADYYRDFQVPSVNTGYIHPRLCPSITSFIDLNDRNVNFTYVRPLENSHSCVTYLVEEKGKPNARFVVKFVRRYNKEAHIFMGNEGYAPRLLAFHPLGKRAGYGDLCIVAMEYIRGKTLYDLYGEDRLPDDVQTKLKKTLDTLNNEGYIFPDLRRPNVMRSESLLDAKLKLIDFDWVCKEGEEARYPCLLTEAVTGLAQVEDYQVIEKRHQDNMYYHIVG